jgi:hypothetical protein
MKKSPVFRPASDRYLPLFFAALSAVVVIFATQTWGLAVLPEQFAWLQSAKLFAADRTLDFSVSTFPAGLLWPIVLSFFEQTGYGLEFVARVWQALMMGLLLYVITRFYLRHLQSRVVVAGTSLAAMTGLLYFGEAFALSPLPTASLLAMLGLLALARFLLEDESLFFMLAAFCLGAAAVLWYPAVVMSVGAALAIMLGARGKFARRLSGVVMFVAVACAPAAILIVDSGREFGIFQFQSAMVAVDAISGWMMYAGWPEILRVLLTLAVMAGLLYVYLATRGPAGIGPALKRRELQVWILLSFVWLAHLIFLPLSATLVVLIPAFVLWPALGIDSFRDFDPLSSALSGRGTTVAVWACTLLLIFPVWQTAAKSYRSFLAGDGLNGFEYQTCTMMTELRAEKSLPIYSDRPELLKYVLHSDVRPLPSELRDLELTESRVVILGDNCPPGICADDSVSQPTLAFVPKLASREGMIYDVTFRAPEPALTATDSLTIP